MANDKETHDAAWGDGQNEPFNKRGDRIATAICDLFDAYDNSGCDDNAVIANVKALAKGSPESLICMVELRDLLNEAMKECEPDTISPEAMEAKAAMYFALGLTMFGVFAMLCYAALRNLP